MVFNRVEPNYTVAKSLGLVVWHSRKVNLTIHEWIVWQSVLSKYADKVIEFDHLVDFRESVWAIDRQEILGAMGFSERFFENDPNSAPENKRKSAVVGASGEAKRGWQEYIEVTNVSANLFK